MEITKEIANQKLIGYRYHKNIYELYDFESNKILDFMERVSIIFSYNPNLDISGTLIKHGDSRFIYKLYEKYIEKLIIYSEIIDKTNIIIGNFTCEELDKILTITGYIGTWYTSYLKGKIDRCFVVNKPFWKEYKK